MAAYKKMKVQVRPDAARLLPLLDPIPHRASIPARSFPLPRPDLIPPPRQFATSRASGGTCHSRRVFVRLSLPRPPLPNRPPDSPAHFIPSHRRNSATRARRRAWTPPASRLCFSSASSTSPAPRRRPPAEEDDELEDIPDEAADDAGDLVDPDAKDTSAKAPAAQDKETPPTTRRSRRPRREGHPRREGQGDPRRRRRCAPQEIRRGDRRGARGARRRHRGGHREAKTTRRTFRMPFQLTDLDTRRLECAKTGKPMPGSKEEAEANRRKLSKGERGDKGAGRDARFRNDGAPKNKAKKGEKNKNNRKQGQQGGGAPRLAPRSPRAVSASPTPRTPRRRARRARRRRRSAPKRSGRPSR